MADKKKLTPKAKKGITIGVIFGVVVALLLGGLIYLNVNDTDAAKFTSKLVIAFMPDTLTSKDNGQEVVFHVEYNEDYNPEKDEPLDAYTVYYFDSNDKRVDLYQGHYITQSAEKQVTLGFLIQAQKNIDAFKNVLRVAIALICLAGAVVLIYLWYKSWCRRQNEKKNIYLRDFADEGKEKEE